MAAEVAVALLSLGLPEIPVSLAQVPILIWIADVRLAQISVRTTAAAQVDVPVSRHVRRLSASWPVTVAFLRRRAAVGPVAVPR